MGDVAENSQNDPTAGQRRTMVRLMAELGTRDSRVLDAMEQVPRHLFVPRGLVDQAYDNTCLPIGHSQTISQPYVVALMTELLRLRGNERVLEVGTGSGYQTAILSLLAREVYTLERIPELYESARKRLAALGYKNIEAVLADGSLGYTGKAPYDGTIVTAAAPRVPSSLLAQLAEGGRLVIPVGDRHCQILERVTRRGDAYDVEENTAVRFVPLIGWGAWAPIEEN